MLWSNGNLHARQLILKLVVHVFDDRFEGRVTMGDAIELALNATCVAQINEPEVTAERIDDKLTS